MEIALVRKRIASTPLQRSLCTTARGGEAALGGGPPSGNSSYDAISCAKWTCLTTLVAAICTMPTVESQLSLLVSSLTYGGAMSPLRELSQGSRLLVEVLECSGDGAEGTLGGLRNFSASATRCCKSRSPSHTVSVDGSAGGQVISQPRRRHGKALGSSSTQSVSAVLDRDRG